MLFRSLERFDNDLQNGETNNRLLFDIFFSRAFYAIEYQEYFLYGLNNSKDPGKLDYVGWYELKSYYRRLNIMGRPEIFDLKHKTYELFHDYYCREFLWFSSIEQKDDFMSFFQRHSAGIIKPTDKLGGRGIEIIRIEKDTDTNQIWSKVSNHLPFVLEELIEQSHEMNIFYPHSVNTIRYNTFYHDGTLTRMQAAFRTGRGGSYVDNATSGGIYTLVDTETGRILGPARSLKDELFETHPDTGTQFEGNSIPRWDELNKLIEKVVRVVPEQKQVGWDFALSKNGWVIVEGNTHPALQAFDLNHGLRPLVISTFGKVVPIWH